MNKSLAYLRLGILFFSAGNFVSAQPSLQDRVDAAAGSDEKVLSLKGEYVLDKPLVLSKKHSGLVLKGDAVLSAGTRVEGWKIAENGLWIADCGADVVESLWVNGKRAQIAQSEEIYYFHSPYFGKTGFEGKVLDDPGRHAFIARNEDLSVLDGLNGLDIRNAYADIYTVWFHSKCPIEAVVKNPDGKTSTVFVKNRGYMPFYKWDDGPRFRICNVKKLLDEEGEFFFDKADEKIFYKPRSGEEISNILAYIPRLSRILEINGKEGAEAKDITIAGLRFAYGGHFPDENWRQESQASASTDGFVRISNASNIIIRDCSVEHCNSYAIAMNENVRDSLIENCVINDAGSGGVKIGGGGRPNAAKAKNTCNITVKNNIICGYGRFDYAGVGVIIFNSGGNTVDGNAIFDGFYTGISVGWTWGFMPTLTQNNKITSNRIFSIGHGLLSDMGGVYTLGNAEGSVISGNEIYNIRRHRYGGWGIYNDEGSQHWVVEKNYVHDTHEDGYFQHYGKNNTIRNNIFENGGTTQFGLGRQGENYPDSFLFERNIVVYSSPSKLIRNNDRISPYNARFDKNIYWNKDGAVDFSGMNFDQWREFGQDANSIAADPGLRDGRLENGLYKKIGFEPFSTANAGVTGNMKPKFDEILKNYSFPPALVGPPAAPWDLELAENLNSQAAGETPKHLRIDSQREGKDVLLMEEDGRRFIRYTDSKCDDRPYIPTGYYTVRLGGGSVRMEFDFRVNEKSTFFVEARGEGSEVGGPAFWVRNGKCFDIDLPKRKWLHFAGVFKMGENAPKSWTCQVFDGDQKLLEQNTGYHKGPILRMGVLVVSSMSNEEGDTFDIANVKVSAP